MPSVEQLTLPLSAGSSVPTQTPMSGVINIYDAAQINLRSISIRQKAPGNIKGKKGGKRGENQELSCVNCHHFLRVGGLPACSSCINIPQGIGIRPYRFLKGLAICSISNYWPIRKGDKYDRAPI